MEIRSFVLMCALGCFAVPGCGGDDDGETGADAGANGAPQITEVSWTHAQPCTQGEVGEVTVAITVVDDDTPAEMLSYSGSVPGCSGQIDANPAIVLCPNVAIYRNGSVGVADPEGNQDSAAFEVSPCEDGTAP